MERYKAKTPSQNRNTNNPTRNGAATSSPPINYSHRMIRQQHRPPPPQRAVYRRHVDNDVAAYRRHVDDDVAAYRRHMDDDVAVRRRHVDDDVAVRRRPVDDDVAVYRRPMGDDVAVYRRHMGDDVAVHRRQVDNDMAAYRRHVDDDVAVYRRHVGDDMAVAVPRYGVYYGSEVWGPYRDSYESQVLNRSSPQITQRPPVIKDQNYYSTKFAPANSDWSPLDDGIEINPTFNAARENFNECVDFGLNGPSQRKRLPVFAYICPE